MFSDTRDTLARQSAGFALGCCAPGIGPLERRCVTQSARAHIKSSYGSNGFCTTPQASIVRSPDGQSYTVRGVKWWTSGASDPRCAVAIFMGKTDRSAAPHRQQSMILVPMDAPGVKVRNYEGIAGNPR